MLPIVTERQRCLAQHLWIANHPHVANPTHYDDPRNTLYVAADAPRTLQGRAAAGVFDTFRPQLQLSCGTSSRSEWRLPAWFHPSKGRTPLTYHAATARWSMQRGACTLRSVAKGQELVLRGGEYPEAREWISTLVGTR